MIDIDLGPLILYSLLFLIITPGIIGFIFGYILVFFLTKTRKKSILLRIIIGAIFAIIFPILFIKVNSLQIKQAEQRQSIEKKAFIERVPNDFIVESVIVEQGKYTLRMSIPLPGIYIVYGAAYQGNQRIAVLYLSDHSFKKGINEINIPAKSTMVKSLPVDFEIKVFSADKSLAFKNNSGDVSVDYGVKYYSPYLDKQNSCYLDYHVPCNPNNKLRVFP